jgi:hypothetical protein
MRDLNYLTKKAQQCEVIPQDDGTYKVFSPSGENYIVRLAQKNIKDHCECKFNHYSCGTCTHILAVHNYLESMRNRQVSVWQSVDDANRQKRPKLQTNDLTLTLRRTQPLQTTDEKPATWIVARMIKTLDSPSADMNHVYRQGQIVYLRYITGKTDSWTIFSGSRYFQAVKMSTAKAQQFITVERLNGKAIKAQDQKEIESQFQMSL